MAGETPDVIADALSDGGGPRTALEVRLWDPSTQLRYRRKRRARPDGPGAGQMTAAAENEAA